jgi:hypothetical protein
MKTTNKTIVFLHSKIYDFTIKVLQTKDARPEGRKHSPNLISTYILR